MALAFYDGSGLYFISGGLGRNAWTKLLSYLTEVALFPALDHSEGIVF